ncbi:phosphosulfolactate synthase [Amycolatopsis benzoatilytica]|uniref:phosphosulfolactate synthase n=1 Tax=Amycolatopsis benzoatilytica TaxID=346045 RepID=UPI0003AAD577|nr:phosphosulfolactate synthase [Amycolatopsis benzoatilytica]
MWDCPDFLTLPEREVKPRTRGLTHVLDKGMTMPSLEALLEQCGHLIDIVKIGWGIAYVDPTVKDRIARCQEAGVKVSLGGTLLEVCATQGRVSELRRWATDIGVDCVEVSNGLGMLTSARKARLIRQLSQEFTVLAETGAKSADVPVVVSEWLAELESDLESGATWLVTEGRESGTVGLYDASGAPRANLVDAISARLPIERVIFEAPRKAQQAWLVGRLGAGVNVGNIASDEVLPLETLRLGLRADTALRWPRVARTGVSVCS